MKKLQTVWNDIKHSLHYGPSTQPMWEAMISKIDELESRISENENSRKKHKIVDSDSTEQTAIKSIKKSPAPMIKSANLPDTNLIGSAGDSIQETDKI